MPATLEPPELADGGYWYAVPAATVSNTGTVPEGVSAEYCAWYAGVNGASYCVVRLLDPELPGGDSSVAISEVVIAAAQAGSIPASEKPRGRIRGR